MSLGLGVVVGNIGLMGGKFISNMLMSSVSLNSSTVESLKVFWRGSVDFFFIVLNRVRG